MRPTEVHSRLWMPSGEAGRIPTNRCGGILSGDCATVYFEPSWRTALQLPSSLGWRRRADRVGSLVVAMPPML
jgi:hypothetical protein